jgi:hypothetical protein
MFLRTQCYFIIDLSNVLNFIFPLDQEIKYYTAQQPRRSSRYPGFLSLKTSVKVQGHTKSPAHSFLLSKLSTLLCENWIVPD